MARDMPVPELTFTGRRSGVHGSVMLTSPRQEGAVLVVVASCGNDHQQGGFLNLRDNPDVQVRLQGMPRHPMRGRVATPAERERLCGTGHSQPQELRRLPEQDSARDRVGAT
jgi:F420H(2)-dependent quinone reductase